MTQKKYKVIEILNNKELIINYGETNGAREGKRVLISIVGDKVIDPETKENLGTLDLIKGDLEIYKTYRNFSICRDITIEEQTLINPLGLNRAKKVQVYHNLNVDEKDITNRWPKQIPPIKVGDEVKIL